MAKTQAQLKDYTDCGVYIMSHDESGKVYVGSSKAIIKRKSRHLTLLKKNQHWNPYLQAAYNKYGASAFTFKTVIACPPDERIFHEQRLIDQYNSADRQTGYNLSRIVDEVTEYSDESRERMRKAIKPGHGKWNLGRRHSEESKRKMSESRKGIKSSKKRPPVSQETRKKISDSRTGKLLSEEIKEKLRVASTGRKHSKETKEKISALNIKTHCKNGHMLGEGNMSYSARGRRCLSCHREDSKRRRQEIKRLAGVSLP